MKIEILNIDCLQGLKKLPDKSINIVITSPPYNIGLKYNTYSDNLLYEDYLMWLENIFSEIKRVLKDDGSFFLNIGYTATNPWLPFDIVNIFRKYFVLQNQIHWIKSIAIQKEDIGNYPNICGDIAVGHYKPINSDRFLSIMHEYIFHLTKTGNVKLNKQAIGVPYQDKSNIKRWKKNKKGVPLRDRGNTWFIPYETIQHREKDRPHPATFPPKLAEMCIKLQFLPLLIRHLLKLCSKNYSVFLYKSLFDALNSLFIRPSNFDKSTTVYSEIKKRASRLYKPKANSI